MRKFFRRIIKLILIIALLIIIFTAGVNAYIIFSNSSRIITSDECRDIQDADCILILGCGVKTNGEPSDMLRDRLLTGIEIYEKTGLKILVSGDHGQINYDEVGTMKNFLIDHGIPSEDIFMDHAGFCTYDSFYRAKEIFDIKKAIVVTQKYHLYRALYLASVFDIEAYGVSSDLQSYKGQLVWSAREIIARNKDFLTSIIKPLPKYLGEKIPLTGSGDVTND